MVLGMLQDAGYDCISAEHADAASRELAIREFNLVLCDIEMPGTNGITLLREIRSTRPDTFVVMLTSVTDPETVMECIRLGANDYLMKPFSAERLLLTVRNVLDQRKLYLAHRSYQETLEEKVKEQTEQIRVSMLEKALISKEMEIAGIIHSALTPRFIPGTPRLSFAAHYLPAGPLGGDYFDIFSREDGILDVVIADVAGHSIGSALIVAQLRGALHVQPAAASLGCGEILKVVNDAFHDDLTDAGLFVSVLYVRIDERRMRLHYACAGHNPGILIRDNGPAALLDADGMIIGVLRDVEFEEKTLPLRAGDVLALYTDGIVEAENEAEEMFGLERLSASLAAQTAHEPSMLLDKVLLSLRKFTGGLPPKDDQTMVVVAVN